MLYYFFIDMTIVSVVSVPFITESKVDHLYSYSWDMEILAKICVPSTISNQIFLSLQMQKVLIISFYYNSFDFYSLLYQILYILLFLTDNLVLMLLCLKPMLIIIPIPYYYIHYSFAMHQTIAMEQKFTNISPAKYRKWLERDKKTLLLPRRIRRLSVCSCPL